MPLYLLLLSTQTRRKEFKRGYHDSCMARNMKQPDSETKRYKSSFLKCFINVPLQIVFLSVWIMSAYPTRRTEECDALIFLAASFLSIYQILFTGWRGLWSFLYLTSEVTTKTRISGKKPSCVMLSWNVKQSLKSGILRNNTGQRHCTYYLTLGAKCGEPHLTK